MPMLASSKGANWIGIVAPGSRSFEHQAEVIEEFADAAGINYVATLVDRTGTRTCHCLDSMQGTRACLLFYDELHVHERAESRDVERLVAGGRIAFARPVFQKDRRWLTKLRTGAISVHQLFLPLYTKQSSRHQAALAWIYYLSATCQFSDREMAHFLGQLGLKYRWGLSWTEADVRTHREAYFKAEGIKEGMERDVWMPAPSRDALFKRAMDWTKAAGLISDSAES